MIPGGDIAYLPQHAIVGLPAAVPDLVDYSIGDGAEPESFDAIEQVDAEPDPLRDERGI